MRPRAATSTNSRNGASETPPSVRGVVENGCGIDFATPPHTRSSLFCMAIQTPIMTSMTVSMDSRRSGRMRTNSVTAPTTRPQTMARPSAAKKFRSASVRAANVA